jgi:hypothetical protein
MKIGRACHGGALDGRQHGAHPAGAHSAQHHRPDPDPCVDGHARRGGIEAGLELPRPGRAAAHASWGTILNDGFANIRDSYWIVIAGGLPIMLTTLGFTFLGETLRDVFDPRLKGR